MHSWQTQSFDHFISTFSWTKKWGKIVLKHSRIVRPRWAGWRCCWFWWFWWGYRWCWWWCWWAGNSLLCFTKCCWGKNLNLTAVFFISDHRIEFKSFNRRTMHSSWSMLVTIKTPSSSATPGIPSLSLLAASFWFTCWQRSESSTKLWSWVLAKMNCQGHQAQRKLEQAQGRVSSRWRLREGEKRVNHWLTESIWLGHSGDALPAKKN